MYVSRTHCAALPVPCGEHAIDVNLWNDCIPAMIWLWQGAMRPWNEGGHYLRQLRQWHFRPFLWWANRIEVEYTMKGNFRSARTWTTIPIKNSSGSSMADNPWSGVGEPCSSNRIDRSFPDCFVQRLHEYQTRVKFQGEQIFVSFNFHDFRSSWLQSSSHLLWM